MTWAFDWGRFGVLSCQASTVTGNSFYNSHALPHTTLRTDYLDFWNDKSAFSLQRVSDRTGHSKRMSNPSSNLPQAPKSLSLRDKNEFDLPQTSNSSTNQLSFHGLPSSAHSFSVSYSIVGKGNLFDFATRFTWITARNRTRNRGSLQWM